VRRTSLEPAVLPGGARLHENRAQTRAPGHLDVPGLIANHPRACRIDAQIATGSLEETGGRLAALAGHLQFRALAGEAAFRMMRTEVDPIEIGALFSELPFQAAVN